MLTLRSGESSLVLAPEIGGAIVGWTFGAVPLLRRPSPDAIVSGNVRGLACFPLVPFSNRIAYGRFHWDGTDHLLDRNFGDHPHTIHGVGWQRAWEVAAVGPASATLTLRHDAAGEQVRAWPFAFAAEQRFMLTPDALHVALTLRNLHRSAAPAGLGLHPYFPRNGAPTLRFNATRVWLNGANSLPSEPVPVPPEWDHSGGTAHRRRSARQLLRRLGRRGAHRLGVGRSRAAHRGRCAVPPSDRLHATRPGLLLRRAGEPHERRDQPHGQRRRTTACGSWHRARRCRVW